MLVPQSVFAISRLCDMETSRYSLGAIKLERDPKTGHPIAIATDGRRMIVCRWKEDSAEYPAAAGFDTTPIAEFSTMIPRKQWDEAGKLSPKRSPKPILQNVVVEEGTANGKITLGATDLETARRITATVPEGLYPAWRNVFPPYAPYQVATTAFDSQYAAEILQVFKGLTDDDHNKVVMQVPLDGTNAIVFTATNAGGVETTAALMPVAIDPDGHREKKAREEAKEAYDKTLQWYAPAELWKAVEPILSAAQRAKLVEDMPKYLTPAQIEAMAPA